MSCGEQRRNTICYRCAERGHLSTECPGGQRSEATNAARHTSEWPSSSSHGYLVDDVDALSTSLAKVCRRCFAVDIGCTSAVCSISAADQLQEDRNASRNTSVAVSVLPGKKLHVASGETYECSFQVTQQITYGFLVGAQLTICILGQFGNYTAPLFSTNDFVEFGVFLDSGYSTCLFEANPRHLSTVQRVVWWFSQSQRPPWEMGR